MGTRRKKLRHLMKIKINLQKLVDIYADMNCQQICKIHAKRINRNENIPKSFRGLFFETPCKCWNLAQGSGPRTPSATQNFESLAQGISLLGANYTKNSKFWRFWAQ